MSLQIQLEDFAVSRLHIDWLPPVKDAVAVNTLQASFDYEIAIQAKNKKRYKLELKLKFREVGVEQPEVGYQIDATVVGVFVFEAATPVSDRQRLIRVNGVNILYGTFRGVLAGLTGVFHGGKLVLPTILPTRIVAEVEARKLEAAPIAISDSSSQSGSSKRAAV